MKSLDRIARFLKLQQWDEPDLPAYKAPEDRGKHYTIDLTEDSETFEWRAELSIPEAHVHEMGSGDYGWQALMNLADIMKRMGLLD